MQKVHKQGSGKKQTRIIHTPYLGNRIYIIDVMTFCYAVLLTEAWKLRPSLIEVGMKNAVPMIMKVARRNIETPLHG